VVLPCRALGVVDVSQKGDNGREENPRLILMPSSHERMGEFEKTTRATQEIEQFFVNATFFSLAKTQRSKAGAARRPRSIS
jgi:hypothetical protein